ncbi:Wzz/FepE/Etk N-terminal domain-containing protein [Saccharospirillum impatiens]|uniref:Wzz/FepE/Etk N-terminal domain-containing protein n=1 Tax=Saccharospirillum impatiens TaxID=169438 RepID=UPI000408A63E|nr:Wzz/FepE/Etk N-terminal domain-containing protein [Saccharospirillum impatiens]
MSSSDPHHASPRYIEDDTIDLGELLRGLIAQWPLIVGITFFGAALGVAVALLLPKQYRVEAIINQPSRQAVQPLLAQQIAPLTLDELSERFLLNIRSLSLIEQAYSLSDLGGEQDLDSLSDEEAFSQIQNVSNALSVGPVRYEFYQLGSDEKTPLNSLSVNLLSSEPRRAKGFIDELLILAEQRTLRETIGNINATKAIRIETAQSRYDQLLAGAEASLARERRRVQQALSIASSLGIEEPTSWEALVLGDSQVQMINQLANDELFLNGSRFLTAQLESLSADGAAELFLEGVEETVFDLNGNQMVITTTPSQLQGEIRALSDQTFALSDVTLLDEDAAARIPSNAEKPNRPLIAIAATVLAGFAALFIALIRMAIRAKKED